MTRYSWRRAIGGPRPYLPCWIGTALLWSTTAAFPWSAMGASVDRTREPALELVQVTAKRRAASTFETPTPVTVIGPEDIAAATPLTVADYLRGEPGTYVQQTTPGQGTIIVRGLKGSEVLHLVDGFRLNNAIFRNAPNQYVALIDAWNLAQIEAARGPMASLYGGDAMGGVVQFLTPMPAFAGDRIEARATLRLQVESANSATAIHTEGEFGTARWTAHGGLTWQGAGRLRVGGGDTLPHTDFQAYGAHGKWILRSAAEETLVLQAQFMRQPETARHDVLVSGFGQTAPSSAEFLYKPQERRFLQARWTSTRSRTFADAIDLQVGFQEMIDDRVSRDFGSSNRDLEQNSSSLTGLIGSLGRQIGDTHYLTYGLELYHDRVDSARRRVDVDSGTVTARPGRFPDGSTMAWFAWFLADEWQLHDLVTLHTAVRYSTYDIDLPPNSDGIGVELSPDDVAGNVGLLFRATDELRLIANVGRAFRPPNIFDLGTFGQRGNRFSLPNPGLEPETVTTWEVGLKFEDARLRAELFTFRSRYEDKITQVLTGEVDPQGRLIVQSQNATALDLEGAEAGVLWQLDPDLSVYASATWVWGEESFADERYPADRIPPLSGRLLARYSLASRWSLEAALHWADEQDRLSPRDETDPRINPDGTAGWATLDVRGDFQATERLRFGFGLENVFDRRYRDHGSGFDAPGRNAVLTVSHQF